MLRFFLAAAAAASLSAAAHASPVNGTGNVTPDVIFGGGNANGSFTGVNINNVELGLRGKLRYDLDGNPQNTFNYDGDRTYTFDPADSDLSGDPDRSAFNFEWSINANVAQFFSGRELDDLTYALRIDIDPTSQTNFIVFDPINGFNPDGFWDHALGTNVTGNGAGVVANNSVSYNSLISDRNVAQNSWNLGFFNPPGFDPATEGLYTIELAAFSTSTFNPGGQLAATSIDIQYGSVPAVPLPAGAWLLLGGFGALGLMRRRQKATAA